MVRSESARARIGAAHLIAMVVLGMVAACGSPAGSPPSREPPARNEPSPDEPPGTGSQAAPPTEPASVEAAREPSPAWPAIEALAADPAQEELTAGASRAPHLAVGDATSAVIAGGRVYVWGDHPEHRPYRNEGLGPIVLRDIDDAAQVAVQDSTVVVLRANGRLVEASEVDGIVSRRLPPLRIVAVSRRSACGVSRRGEVHCWRGFDADAPDRPARIAGVAGATSLALQEYVGCARISDGTVRCFGEGDGADFGIGEADFAQRVATVRGLDDVVELAATGSTMCALRHDATVHCWGDRLDGASERDGVPTHVAALNGAIAIHAGPDGLLCARRRDGRVACAGRAVPGFPVEELRIVLPHAVEAIAARGATELAIGRSHACWLDARETVRCVGENTVGQLGELPRRTVELEIPGVRAAWVSGGAGVTCAGGPSGAWCWGQADRLSELRPYSISLPTPADVRGAWFATTSCVLRSGGRLTCYEGLRDASPRLVAEVEGVVELSGRCARFEGGAVRCGSGAPTAEVPGGPFRLLVANDRRGCAVASADSRVHCWDVESPRGTVSIARARVVGEAPGAEQLALSSFVSVRVGTAVQRVGASALEGSFEEIGGAGIGCGRSGGTVACWGYGDMAQLMAISGEGHPDAGPEPWRVPGLTDAVALSPSVPCALRPEGRVACWESIGGFGVGRLPAFVRLEPVTVALPR